MASQASFVKVLPYDSSLLFQFSDGDSFSVKSLNNGIMVIKPLSNFRIDAWVNKITEFFNEGSNFKGLKAIEFELNGVYVPVTANNATPDRIIQLMNEKMEENRVKLEKEYAEYQKTPEYRYKKSKELKIAARRQIVEQYVINVDKATELEFKDDEAAQKWAKFVAANSQDGYSYSVVIYALRWAKYMQHIMKKHNKTVFQIAQSTSLAANLTGTTSYRYDAAVTILSQCWKYGEDLRKWYNKEYD